MNRGSAIDLLDRLHAAQNDFYGGGSGEALRRLLAAGITWTIPGENRIAGTYCGVDEVFGYFERRRDLAGRTFHMERKDVLVGAGDLVAALSDGTATIDEIERRWSTVGLYDIGGERISACWLLALDQRAFDEIWG